MGDDEVRRAYARLAGRYIELFGSTEQVEAEDLDLIVRRLSGRPGVVLDVGCGPGHLSAHLRWLGVDVLGIDQVPEFVEHAQRADPGAWCALGSIARLPVADGSVAGVLAWYSLIHLRPDALDVALRELRRVTVPGGTLVVGWFDGDEVGTFDHTVTTAHRWPVDELVRRLQRAGFVELERQRRPGVDVAGRRPHPAIAAIAR